MASAHQAIQDWGGDKMSITHVVAVTCTGVIVPGLEFYVSVKIMPRHVAADVRCSSCLLLTYYCLLLR